MEPNKKLPLDVAFIILEMKKTYSPSFCSDLRNLALESEAIQGLIRLWRMTHNESEKEEVVQDLRKHILDDKRYNQKGC